MVEKKKKVVTYFNQMVGVSWGVCGRSYVSASPGQGSEGSLL